MGQPQRVQLQHLLSRSDLATGQSKHHRVVFLYPLTRLLYRIVEDAALFTMLALKGARTLFCRPFPGNTLK